MKPKQNDILMGAQFWAYGPAGKANAIAHELKNLGRGIDFVGAETSYQLCKASGNFNNLYDFNSGPRLDGFRDYRAVVSVMDPYLALWAHKRKIPLIYADSMSWFWRWKNIDPVPVRKVVSHIDKISFKEGCKALDIMEPDQRQLFAHLVSDRILGQGSPQVVAETKNKASNAGSMIDLNYIKKTKRDTLLISLSGGISPATNLSAALRYSKLVLDLLGDKLTKWPGAKRFVMTGHPLVISKIKKYPNFLRLAALSQRDFLKELNRAVAVLVPCGFTTIYESLAYGAPVAFLPENHNGHVYEYLTITKGISGLNEKERIFPNVLFCLKDANLNKIKPIEESMNLIKNYSDRYFNSINFKKFYSQKIDQWLNDFKNSRTIYANQRKQILTTIPDFHGAARVAKAVKKIK
jgi:hypothetical protein